MLIPSCCICAQHTSSDSPPLYSEKSEKVVLPVRLQCCQRSICPSCIQNYPRFRIYCPYCQKSLREDSSSKTKDAPDWHGSSMVRKDAGPQLDSETIKEKDSPDVLHFVDPSIDSIGILSVRYGVPAGALRRSNALFSDHLLAARRTIVIPGEFYKGGVSLSPRPKDGEEEEIRKGKIRRFQVTSKCADYNTALLYLDQSSYDVDLAIQIFQEDDAWERAHPLSKGKQPKKAGLRFR